MRNIWCIFKTDMKHLFNNSISVIIVIGLVFLPSIFTWYNVIACWDAFGNTGNLTVAVANTDEGYESDLVPLEINVGDKVVSALRANDQLDIHDRRRRDRRRAVRALLRRRGDSPKLQPRHDDVLFRRGRAREHHLLHQ